MHFLGVAMGPQGVDLRVGHFDFGGFFAGQAGGPPPLPELVFAFDFAFGLGRGGVAQADVIELERPAPLGPGVRILREEDTVVIDVDWERTSVGQESGGQEVELREEEFRAHKSLSQ